jgi:hypothetical protein
LIGGQLRCRGRSSIIAGQSTVLWLAPEDHNDRAPSRVHQVEAHWRLLASGKSVRVRAHVRGLPGIARRMKSSVNVGSIPTARHTRDNSAAGAPSGPP